MFPGNYLRNFCNPKPNREIYTQELLKYMPEFDLFINGYFGGKRLWKSKINVQRMLLCALVSSCIDMRHYVDIRLLQEYFSLYFSINNNLHSSKLLGNRLQNIQKINTLCNSMLVSVGVSSCKRWERSERKALNLLFQAFWDLVLF